MNIKFTFLSFVLILFSCQDVVKKPKNLIPEDEMINILYDFALLEGIKTNYSLNQQALNTEKFIYKKYKIDSLQFFQSNAYYASDVKNYKEMYQKLSSKIDVKKTAIDSLIKKKNNPKVIKKRKPVVK